MSNLTNIYSKSMELRVTHIIFYRSPRFFIQVTAESQQDRTVFLTLMSFTRNLKHLSQIVRY